MIDQDQIRSIKEKAEAALFRIPGVHAVGVGHKNIKGQYTQELSIKVYVLKKKALSEIDSKEVIPPEIEGIKTDVVEAGPPELCDNEDTKSYRPVRGGTSIQVHEISSKADHGTITTTTVTETGTMGCIAQTSGNPSVVVGVTNQHVLTVNGNFTKGRSVGQTSADEYSICSKCCSEIIGVILDGINDADVDVALIKLNRKLDYYNQQQDEPNNVLITGTYSLQTKGIPSSPFHVKKRGERTRLTTGTIDSVSTSTLGPPARSNVISIKPDSGLFDDNGDSGSVVLSNETSAAAQSSGAGPGTVIGLLYAKGAGGFGYAFDIGVVQNKLAGINLPINILTATALNSKQTVPDTNAQANAYMVDVAEKNRSAEALAAEAQMVQKVQTELLQHEAGQVYLGLFQRHQEEVRKLIDSNKRVAAAWRRNGGPTLVRSIVHVVQSPEEALPQEIEGSSLQECINRIIHVFKKYGSPALASDIAEFGAALGQFGGRTYAQILSGLAELAVAR